LPKRFESTIHVTLLVGALIMSAACAAPEPSERNERPRLQRDARSLALIDQLAEGPLRTRLDACRDLPIRSSRFSIAHRGAPLRYPEHTRESYLAAARMGAGVIECDVTFTSDRALVCRHAQCDLATTTNILETELAARCSEGFAPAVFDEDTGDRLRAASARCCTSDLTLAEFKSLSGRHDRHDPDATSVKQWLRPQAEAVVSGYPAHGELMTHAESIELFQRLGVAMAPELKVPEVEMPFEGDYSRQNYAQALLDAYLEAGVPADRVTFQAFSKDDILYWLSAAPEFGQRAAWGTGGDPRLPQPSQADFEKIRSSGIRRLAPPLPRLLELDAEGEIVASAYARQAREAGLELIPWTLERSGVIRAGSVDGRSVDFYLGTILSALESEGDIYRILQALHEEVGASAVFSDWPGTTTYYANCVGLP
jgi:glycerophosphoryl diester phosphodiesterase